MEDVSRYLFGIIILAIFSNVSAYPVPFPKEKLFQCATGGSFIQESHQCNGIYECPDKSDENDCENDYCATEESHGFLWLRAQVGSETVKSCAVANSSWAGIFGSKCMRSSSHTEWQHLSTCTCERKSTLESFRNKFANLSDSNFLNVSNDLATAAENGEFTNIRVFHELFIDLFYNVTRSLTPLTVQNSGKALQYCQHFIKTLLSSPIYWRKSSFCGRPKLIFKREDHVRMALEFLRQAPNSTKAYHFGKKRIKLLLVELSTTVFFEKFKAQPPVVIQRGELCLQLNRAQLLPREELTNEEIGDLLRANNYTNLKFDEEVGAFVYNKDILNEYQKHEEIQTNMELVLMCISTAAVLMALILLTVLKLKSSEKLFIHKSLLLSLGLGNLVSVMDITLFDTREKHTALCTVVTVIQYFFHTAIFSWMLVEGINLYIKLVKVFSAKKQYVAYVALGWGIPTVIMGLVAAISPSTFDMARPSYTDISCGALQLTARNGRRRCWINGSLWIYKGPILGILVPNTVLFVILLRVIFGKISTRYGGDNMQVAKKGIRSTVALLPLLGVTWLLGFFVELHHAVAYIFILLNSTQGMVFFIFHCVLDEEVQDATRKLFDKLKMAS